jgi:hypothetical protein
MRRVIIAAIVLLSLLALGIGVLLVINLQAPSAGSVGIIGGADGPTAIFTTTRSENRELLLDETFSASGIENLELRLSSEEVDIYPSEDANFRVVQYGVNLDDSQLISAEVDGDTLTVDKHFTSNSFFSFGFHYYRSWVEIYVPEGYHETLDLGLSSGEITLHDDLDLSSVTVRVSSGSVRSESEIKTPNADIYVTSGSVKLAALEAEAFDIGVSSGSVGITALAGSGALEATSGRIVLDNVSIGDSLDMKTSSGSIRMTLEGDPSLEFAGKESSGNIRTYFETYHRAGNDKESFATLGDGPYKQITAQVTSGSISIDGSTSKESNSTFTGGESDNSDNDDWEDDIDEWADNLEDDLDAWADELEEEIDRWD